MSYTSNYVTNPSDLLASKPYYVYEILGCSEKESFEGPHVAYLCLRYYALSRIFNPVYANPFNEDQKRYFDKMYDAVNIAFVILSNPDYKAKYDQAGTVDLHAFLRNIGVTSEDELQSFSLLHQASILILPSSHAFTPRLTLSSSVTANTQVMEPARYPSPSILVPPTPAPSENLSYSSMPSISTPQTTTAPSFIGYSADQTSTVGSGSECLPCPNPPLLPTRKPFGRSKDDIISTSYRKRPNSVQITNLFDTFGKRCKKEN